MKERVTRTRRGGSAARRAVKATAAPASAVHPGLSGGQYRPLSDADVQRIYATALDILENIGIGEPIPEVLHYALPKGCVLNEKGRLCFPRSLVEDLIAISPKEYALYAPGPSPGPDGWREERFVLYLR